MTARRHLEVKVSGEVMRLGRKAGRLPRMARSLLGVGVPEKQDPGATCYSEWMGRKSGLLPSTLIEALKL